MSNDAAIPTARGKRLWLAFVIGVAVAAAACSSGGGGFSAAPGGRIAFVTTRDGKGEIYVMKGDGSGPTRITNDPAEDLEPWWSPDGSRIAFSSYRGGAANVFTMAADGSDIKQLTDDPFVKGGAHWSPDGSRLAIYSFRQPSQGTIWVMKADGSGPRTVLTGQQIARETPCSGGFPGGWFPDGKRILYRGSQGSAKALQICAVNEDGSGVQDGSGIEVILSEDKVLSYFPALSPDGSKIAFTSNRDGNPDVYVMNTGGGGIQRITDDGGIDEYPTWSPDGQWLAFHSNRDGDYDIYIARPDGSDTRRLTNNKVDDTQPSWSK